MDFQRIIMLGIFTLFSQCYLISENPIGGAQAVFQDTRLPGLWRQTDKPGYLLVSRLKDNTLLIRYLDDDFSEDAEYFSAVTSKYKEYTFLNARRYVLFSNTPAHTGFIPVHYTFEEKQLVLALLNNEIFDIAIQEKQLSGKASQKKSSLSGSPTILTENPEQTAEFIVKQMKNPLLLDKKIRFKRVT